MKLLLTSGGITNPSIRDALDGLLGKPIGECNALCVPTALHPMSGGTAMARRFVSGLSTTPLTELGWQSLGLLELTALAGIDRSRWLPAVQEADALLVSGGDPLYLAHWLRASGLADLLPSLPLVYVGISAGSMALSADFAGETYGGFSVPDGTAEPLGMVDFAVFPHLDHPSLPENTTAHAEAWAAQVVAPTYAIDDDTALRVVDGRVDVVSEGRWQLFPR